MLIPFSAIIAGGTRLRRFFNVARLGEFFNVPMTGAPLTGQHLVTEI